MGMGRTGPAGEGAEGLVLPHPDTREPCPRAREWAKRTARSQKNVKVTLTNLKARGDFEPTRIVFPLPQSRDGLSDE